MTLANALSIEVFQYPEYDYKIFNTRRFAILNIRTLLIF